MRVGVVCRRGDGMIAYVTSSCLSANKLTRVQLVAALHLQVRPSLPRSTQR